MPISQIGRFDSIVAHIFIRSARRVLFLRLLSPSARTACVWLMCLFTSAGHAAFSQTLQAARTLQIDGVRANREHRPVIVLFSLPGCHFCDEIRQNYLVPLVRDAAPGHVPIIREIVITGTRAIVNFNGEPTTEQIISKHYGVRVTPTVLMLDATGELLTPPLIGGDTSGFYDGYLQQALATASEHMHSK
jgi:hypothetical protein